MKKNILKALLLLFVITLFVIAYRFDLDQYLKFGYLKENIDSFQNYYQAHTLKTTLLFLIFYTLATALSFPGATIFTLAAGALFGTFKGTIIVSFASTIGATLAFLTARFLLKDFVQQKFSDKLKKINEGIKREGALYLFTLRLIPIFPFFLINLVMGLTPISIWTYFWVSQVGMLLGTIVYVNAGSKIANLNSLSEILSVEVILSFIFIGIVPYISKAILSFIKSKKAFKGFKKPKHFDYNMIVIGAGSGGLVTSYICSTVKAKVALIEKNLMGGDCLNTGCVPSKTLIKSANTFHQIKNSAQYGIEGIQAKINFSQVMDRVQSTIKKIEPHDSVERYTKLGVECFTGKANILSPWEVEINGKVLTTKNITIATGARPFIPKLKGIENVHILSSDNIWQLQELPQNLLILGAGPIGLEMAQAFQRMGSQVTVIERGRRILSKEDPEVSSFLFKKLTSEGLRILTEYEAIEFKDSSTLIVRDQTQKDIELSFDQVLIAVGRTPNTKGFGLEKLNIKFRENGTIDTNDFMQTTTPNIWACGDVTGPYQLTHTASHQAWYCAVNALFGLLKKFRVDYSAIPWTTFTSPEVSTVGITEVLAKEKNIDYELTTYEINDLDRAIADGTDEGFIRVLTKKGSDKVLGATIVGYHSSDLLLEFVAAIKHGFGLNDILSTTHAYPTMGEANKYLAGNWKKAHKPKKLLSLVKRFHEFRR